MKGAHRLAKDSEKKTSFQKLPEAIRQANILKAAQQCFAEKGFSDTSVQDIAQAANLTKGGIYFHFNSKEMIRDELIKSFINTTMAALTDKALDQLPAAEKLQKQMHILVDSMSEGTGFILLLTEAVTRHKTSIECTKDYYQEISLIFSSTIEHGRKTHQFENNKHTQSLVEFLLKTLTGLALCRELDKSGINLCSGKEETIKQLMDLIQSP